MTKHIAFLTIASLMGWLHCAEWLTSSGYVCTERCQAGSHRLGNAVVDHVLTCPVVDGVELEHRPGYSTGQEYNEDRELSEDDKYKWDYCSPAQIEAVVSEDEELGEMEAVPLPAHRENGGSGYNPGRPDSAILRVQSSIEGVKCQGECSKATNSEQHKCEISYTGINNFFCSPDSPLYRQQLSSKYKLWCLSPCTKPDFGTSNFMCKTMFGFDLCSPNSGMTATGRKCHGTCHEDPQDDQGHYKCFVDSARTVLEHCSPMASDLPGDTVTHALEFSNEGKVCAGRCHNRDGTKMCDVVSWEWNEDERKAELELGLETCGADGGSSWATIGIIIGCVLAAIAIIAIVAVIVAKKKYRAVNTQDNP